MNLLDPRTASVAYTPLDLRHRLHPTIGRMKIVPTAEVDNVLDPAPEPLDHAVHARPVQSNSYAEAVPVVPEGEADPLKGALITAVRLITMDGLDAGMVLAKFAAELDGWSEAIPDGRYRHHHRLASR